MEQIKKINLDRKYFKNTLKPAIISAIIINVLILILISALLFYIYFSLYSKLNNNFKLRIIYNFNRDIYLINETVTNSILKKEKIDELIKFYLQDPYIFSIWISDSEGTLLFHSKGIIQNQTPNLKDTKEYNFVFQHNWMFNPDGSVVPLYKMKKEYNYTEMFCPVYSSMKKIQYISSLKFKKHITKSLYIPGLKVYINSLYITICGLILLMILLIITPLLLVFKSIQNKKMDIDNEFIRKINETKSENNPFEFEVDKKYVEDPFLNNVITYINELSAKFYSLINSERSQKDKISRILPPALFKARDMAIKHKKSFYSEKQITTDNIYLQQYLKELAYKNTKLEPIPEYSIGIYHHKQVENTNIIFKYFTTPDSRKGLFIGRLAEENINKKVLLISLLSYIFENKKKLSNAHEYMVLLNQIISKIHVKELALHGCCLVLDLRTNYLEIASTSFSPVIYIKGKLKDPSYYKFNSLLIGKESDDKFSKKLKKEAFQFNQGDILCILDPLIHQTVNKKNKKLEIQIITDIITKNRIVSADVISEKIKDTIDDFNVDFSRVKELFILTIKRHTENE